MTPDKHNPRMTIGEKIALDRYDDMAFAERRTVRLLTAQEHERRTLPAPLPPVCTCTTYTAYGAPHEAGCPWVEECAKLQGEGGL